MEDFSKYLQKVSDGLKTLNQDIDRMIAEKKKEEKKPDNKEETAQDKKEKADASFKKIPLKSLQPITKMYKDKKDIEKSKENPELDFITKQIEEIFK